MNEEEIKQKALELITEWVCIAFIIIMCCFGWWKIIELLAK